MTYYEDFKHMFQRADSEIYCYGLIGLKFSASHPISPILPFLAFGKGVCLVALNK